MEFKCVFDHFPKYHIKHFGRRFYCKKLGREEFFKLTFGNETLHEDNNGVGVRVE